MEAFAAVVHNGTLNGSTIVIEAVIEPVDMMSGYPCMLPPRSCLVGQLADTEPHIWVFAQTIQVTAEDPHATYSGADVTWQYWAVPGPSIAGLLALSVDSRANTNLVGQVRMDVDDSVWGVPDAAALDVSSIDTGEVVLVDAWLTGIDQPLFCTAPANPRIEGLPSNDWCSDGAWLMSTPVQLDPSNFSIPSDAIHVQSGAFDEWAPEPGLRNGFEVVPQHAIYAISRRLFGAGRSETPPFWDWAIVGRVDI